MSDPLETLIGRALRKAPLRRAPHSLESRVLREIDRRAALPWWRRSFSRWPRGARVGFLLAGGLIVAFVIGATGTWGEGGASAAASAWSVGSWLPWVRPALILVEVTRQLDAALAGVVPHQWLYGALAAAAILYAALFALGAAAYRTFFLETLSPGESRS